MVHSRAPTGCSAATVSQALQPSKNSASSTLSGQPERPPNFVHFIAAAADAHSPASSTDAPSESAWAKAPCIHTSTLVKLGLWPQGTLRELTWKTSPADKVSTTVTTGAGLLRTVPPIVYGSRPARSTHRHPFAPSVTPTQPPL